MKAYRHLVKHALAAGHSISVFDGEEWACKRCTGFKTITADIESVDEAQIIVRDAAGNKIAWALIIPGLDDDETVADHSDNEFMNTWYSTYNQ